jgi:hypothetical protein
VESRTCSAVALNCVEYFMEGKLPALQSRPLADFDPAATMNVLLSGQNHGVPYSGKKVHHLMPAETYAKSRMDIEHTPPAHVAAFFAALDDYIQWLSSLGELQSALARDMSTGQRELQKVLDLRRTSFPALTPEVTEVLVVHTELTGLLYEHQLHGPPKTTAGKLAEHLKCADLVQTQFVLIELLRRHVVESS